MISRKCESKSKSIQLLCKKVKVLHFCKPPAQGFSLFPTSFLRSPSEHVDRASASLDAPHFLLCHDELCGGVSQNPMSQVILSPKSLYFYQEMAGQSPVTTETSTTKKPADVDKTSDPRSDPVRF